MENKRYAPTRKSSQELIDFALARKEQDIKAGIRQDLPPDAKPDDTGRYEVLLYDWEGNRGFEASRFFDEYPNFWDLAIFCADNGIGIEDFINEKSSHLGDRYIYGRGVKSSVGMRAVVRFLIARKGREKPSSEEVLR